eukprot:TRINITY_DN44385_c0_g1_i4.p5 TRINITY_DN44385_c0_g1~~TRINITY_DN44385_c0_g1_i4.p5  ORF type:complete len:197 (-),score=-3.90 TRINITY_DN44385_c0_g1_i4:105-695(-)
MHALRNLLKKYEQQIILLALRRIIFKFNYAYILQLHFSLKFVINKKGIQKQIIRMHNNILGGKKRRRKKKEKVIFQLLFLINFYDGEFRIGNLIVLYMHALRNKFKFYYNYVGPENIKKNRCKIVNYKQYLYYFFFGILWLIQCILLFQRKFQRDKRQFNNRLNTDQLIAFFFKKRHKNKKLQLNRRCIQLAKNSV